MSQLIRDFSRKHDRICHRPWHHSLRDMHAKFKGDTGKAFRGQDFKAWDTTSFLCISLPRRQALDALRDRGIITCGMEGSETIIMKGKSANQTFKKSVQAH